MSELNESSGATESSASSDVFEALLDRYTPAYKAAKNLYTGAMVVFVLCVAGALALVFTSKGKLFPIAIVVTVGGIVMAMLLAIASSFLRALLDGTVFKAPGLTDQERLDLAYKAGGQRGPRLR